MRIKRIKVIHSEDVPQFLDLPPSVSGSELDDLCFLGTMPLVQYVKALELDNIREENTIELGDWVIKARNYEDLEVAWFDNWKGYVGPHVVHVVRIGDLCDAIDLNYDNVVNAISFDGISGPYLTNVRNFVHWYSSGRYIREPLNKLNDMNINPKIMVGESYLKHDWPIEEIERKWQEACEDVGE